MATSERLQLLRCTDQVCHGGDLSLLRLHDPRGDMNGVNALAVGDLVFCHRYRALMVADHRRSPQGIEGRAIEGAKLVYGALVDDAHHGHPLVDGITASNWVSLLMPLREKQIERPNLGLLVGADMGCDHLQVRVGGVGGHHRREFNTLLMMREHVAREGNVGCVVRGRWPALRCAGFAVTVIPVSR